MANKLLILGAAMAHKNKSYNLSNPIVKAVDDSLAKFIKILQQRQKSIAQTSIRTQGYLDQLPENPEVELLPEPIRKVYFGELSKVRQNIANLNAERYNESKAALYMPGTDAYNDIMSNIAKEEKRLKTLLGYATKFQQVNADWFREHGNISETWKMMNPDLYEAMSNILNTENPNYTVSFDDEDKLIFETQIKESISNQDPKVLGTPSEQFNQKSVKFGLDELDWAQFSNAETVEINKFFKKAVQDGQQGKTLNAVDINDSRMLLDNLLGNDEAKIFSLALDTLPMGVDKAPMPLFTDQEFETMFPDFDENDPNTYPNISKIKTAVIEKLLEKINTANEIELKKYNIANIDEDFEDFAGNVASFYGGLKGLGDKPSEKDIINYIVNSSPFKGEVNMSSGSTLVPKSGSVSQSTMEAFDVGPEIKRYIDSGYTNADALIAAIIRETRSSREANKVPRYFRQWNAFSKDKKNEYFAPGL